MNKLNSIEPRISKGFRDFDPKEQMMCQWCQTLQHTCAQLEYVPIDTPMLEYADILLGKSGSETEIDLDRLLVVIGDDCMSVLEKDTVRKVDGL